MGYTYVPDVLKVRMSEGDQAKGLDCKPENDREGGDVMELELPVVRHTMILRRRGEILNDIPI